MNLKKFFFSSTPKHSGESILEVLVAIMILASVLISTFSMLNRSMGANQNIKNRIIALNIAREGLEAVRNIRDTNWLKYSGDRRDKWLCWDKEDSLNPEYLNTCLPNSLDPDKKILDGFYRIDFSPDQQRYFLEEQGPSAELDLSVTQIGRGDLQLYTIPTGQTFAGRFTHQKDDGAGTNYNPMPFFRQIEIDIQNPISPDPNSICTGVTCTDHRVLVTSRVAWSEEGRIQTITLETYLYDYYERNAY